MTKKLHFGSRYIKFNRMKIISALFLVQGGLLKLDIIVHKAAIVICIWNLFLKILKIT